MTEQILTNLNKADNAVIKSIFKDNEELLKVTRACMFGLGLSEDEKNLLKNTYSQDNLMRIMRKKFLPTLDKNTPIGQVADVWLGVESQVYGQSRDTIEQSVQYKLEAIKLTEKALALLVNPDGEQIDLKYDPNLHISDPLRINLLARNQYIRHVEQQLMFLKVIAEQEIEPTDEKVKRIAKDSAK